MGQMSQTNPTAGLQQVTQLLAVEHLGLLAEDGRVEPQLAEHWAAGRNGRSLVVTLRSGLTFHDGSSMDAAAVATILPAAIRATFGSIADDVDYIRALDPKTVEIAFRWPSPFLLESLEAPIRKAGHGIVATGPFMATADSTTELRANTGYHAGTPQIGAIRLETFPSLRSAWAELLRDNIDMLWEVGPNALASLQSSAKVTVFTFTRQYQYAIAFNRDASSLKSAAVRRALNLAIDRSQLVRQALNQHGLPSSSALWPKYWALGDGVRGFQFDPRRAAAILAGHPVRFTLLIASDELYERIALELKRQLAAVGVDMNIRSASPDELFAAQSAGKYDAVLTEAVSGPTMLRLYVRWQTHGSLNPGAQGNETVDAALERVRRAEDDSALHQAVSALQQAFLDDPPAIFLAWSERARAVSTRFAVPRPEPGADVVRTLRLWTPRNDDRFANRN